MILQLVPATRHAVKAIQKQQNPTSLSSTHKKNLHVLAGIVVAGILLESVHSRHIIVASAKNKDIKSDSAPHLCSK